MGRKVGIWLFVATVIILPVTVLAIMNWYQNRFSDLPVYGEKGQKIEDFRMVNQNGEVVTLKKWDNKIAVVDFFFTHCPSVCPKMTANLKKVQEAYKEDPMITISSFSVDPERDSSVRMKEFARKFKVDDQNWDLLTGDKTEIYRLARKSFMVVATDGDGGPTDFIHSDKLVLVDKNKKIRGFYDGTSETETKNLINDIKKLKNEN
jgi:protein SCO1/2